MAESKLGYLISRFSDAELEDFGKVLLSIPSRRDEILVQLLNLAHQGEQDNQVIYQAIYPDKEFSDKQMRNLRSDLYKRLLDHLAMKEVSNSPEKQLYLLRGLNKRGAHRQTLKMGEKVLQNNQQYPHSLDQLELNSLLMEEVATSRWMLSDRISQNFTEMLHQTEEAFVARIIYKAIAYHTNQSGFFTEPAPPPLVLWTSILSSLENGEWSKSPLIQIFFALYQLISQVGPQGALGKVRVLLQEHIGNLAQIEALNAYQITLNYCKTVLNKGHDWILEDIFQIYRAMNESKLLELGGTFLHWHFKSMVLVGLRTNRLTWTENFVAEKTPLLPEPFRELMEQFALGAIAFFQSNFPRAERHMIKALDHCGDPFLSLDIRSYLLRIHFETGNLVGTESLLHSFRLFIRRHKHLPEKRLKNYKEFIRFFRRYISLTPGNLKQAERLYQEILTSQQYACRSWLIEKMKKYLKTKSTEPVD